MFYKPGVARTFSRFASSLGPPEADNSGKHGTPIPARFVGVATFLPHFRVNL
ncbi:hypothetical protein [Aliiroseovarius crassostreae]|uniref:hypothetical protein n=1 Tax=Aliiroseovarius crassostreae TaxID=154981 RepID=UPI003C7DD302